MVASDDEDGLAEVGQVAQERIEERDGLCRRCGPVEHVPREEDGVGRLLACDVHDLGKDVLLVIVERPPAQRLAEVQVGDVQEFHGCCLLRVSFLVILPQSTRDVNRSHAQCPADGTDSAGSTLA